MRCITIILLTFLVGLAVSETVLDVPILVKPNHISMKIPSSSLTAPILYTFAPDATVKDLLNSPVASKLGENCMLVAGEEDVLSEDVQISAAVHNNLGKEKKSLIMECEKSSVILNFYIPTMKGRRHTPFNMTLLSDADFIESSRKFMSQKKSVAREYPFEPADVIADGIEQALAWGWNWLTNHWGTLHPFNTYEGTNDTGIYHLNTGEVLRYTGEKRNSESAVNVATAADWGSGTRESDYVSQLMVSGFDADYTIHVGDVYLIGTPEEVQSNCLGIPPPNVQKGVTWPSGKIGTFALNGNHETYSRCYGYMDHWFPNIGMRDPTTGKNSGQKASYFALENDYWRIIALDTGYHTYSILVDSDNNTQPDPVIDWLLNVVNISNPDDKRGIVFMSHHEYRSAFDGGFLATPKQLADILPPDRHVLWLWGHEHRLAFYNLNNTGGVPLTTYARCIGVGGFPVSLDPVPADARSSGLEVYDDRIYNMVEGLWNQTVGYNGFARMTFDTNTLSISYHSLELGADGKVSNQDSTLLVQETFTADLSSGNVEQTYFNIVNKNLTVVQQL